MSNSISFSTIFSWFFGLLVFTIGILNLVLVHPVPAVICILLSLLFPPPVNSFLQQRFGFTIPFFVKLALALFVIWFTLGVSDLGDMLDDL